MLSSLRARTPSFSRFAWELEPESRLPLLASCTIRPKERWASSSLTRGRSLMGVPLKSLAAESRPCQEMFHFRSEKSPSAAFQRVIRLVRRKGPELGWSQPGTSRPSVSPRPSQKGKNDDRTKWPLPSTLLRQLEAVHARGGHPRASRLEADSQSQAVRRNAGCGTGRRAGVDNRRDSCGHRAGRVGNSACHRPARRASTSAWSRRTRLMKMVG